MQLNGFGNIICSQIWLGAEQGIVCLDLQTFAVEGKIPLDSPVVGPFFTFEDNHVIV